MTESAPNSEAHEAIPTEEQVFDALSQICGERAFTEVNRVVREGKIKELDIRLDGLDENGYQVQLVYSVSKTGDATIDVTYFDPGKGFDYRPGAGYDPMDIVNGGVLGRIVNGVWKSEETL
jgi:hypothetical protein